MCREALFFAFFAYREEKKDAVSFSVRCREPVELAPTVAARSHIFDRNSNETRKASEMK